MENELEILRERRLIIVANRAPYNVRQKGKEIKVEPTVGGLVSALDPILKQVGGLWIAWQGQEKESDPDEEFQEKIGIPGYEDKYHLLRLRLTGREVTRYYYGFANQALWPLSHYMLGRCVFDDEHWEENKKVNQKFAGALVQEASSSDMIWIQDYPLVLVPAMAREKNPRLRLGFFWHIPFPSYEIFGVIPWRKEILEGMLGSDLVGFHLPSYAANFLRCVQQFLDLPVDFNRMVVKLPDREVRVGAFPIGVDYQEIESEANIHATAQKAWKIRQMAGADYIVLGVDRLDYTKGILERLLALERLFEKYPQYRGKVSFFQIAVPSRTKLSQYHHMKQEIDEAVGRINGRFTEEIGWIPIRYLYRSLPRKELVAFYRAADVALITPLRDGMNLVAKEYVAAKVDNNGVLVLSEFAGAGEELIEAFLINPYNIDETADIIKHAIELPFQEKADRMEALKKRVHKHSIFWWVKEFLHSFPPPSKPPTRPSRKGAERKQNGKPLPV